MYLVGHGAILASGNWIQSKEGIFILDSKIKDDFNRALLSLTVESIDDFRLVNGSKKYGYPKKKNRFPL